MRQKIARFAGNFILLSAAVILLPFLTLVNKEIAYYAYKEATYDVIIKDVIKNEEDAQTQLIMINEFLYRNFSSPYRGGIIDKDIFNDLIRGRAWCDQRAWALVTFAGKLGIEARLVFTKDREGSSTHTVSEAMIKGQWMLFDPQFGFFGRKNSKYPASYDELCRHPELFLLSEKMLMLKKVSPETYALTSGLFSSNIYYKDYFAPVFWRGPVNSRNLLRKAISGVIDGYVKVFGRNFAFLYQDAYLILYSPSEGSRRIYFCARNYDLYSRYSLADAQYQKLINGFPQAAETQDALYFLGVLYYKIGSYESSISMFKALLRDFPQTQWQACAYYYLGYNYDLSGKEEVSARHYKAASDLYKESSPDSVSSEELKLTERLFKR